ncbi:hypothetical protein GW924_04575 [Candidatus Pacearchaeota archaeon]|nr:hypothetical protein [Candidatus Pacearchaeota archaeon]OIO44041.1 MAG: hypothetical protein AUJ64_00815 [Candidatus Pacearchaeota archaeon CG1_02_39_14]QBM01504.1 hypothetical protein [uncultured archaeon]
MCPERIPLLAVEDYPAVPLQDVFAYRLGGIYALEHSLMETFPDGDDRVMYMALVSRVSNKLEKASREPSIGGMPDEGKGLLESILESAVYILSGFT